MEGQWLGFNFNKFRYITFHSRSDGNNAVMSHNMQQAGNSGNIIAVSWLLVGKRRQTFLSGQPRQRNSHLQCAQIGHFTRWTGQSCIQHYEYDAQPEKPTPCPS